MIRRPPRSTLFPYNDALPISQALALKVGKRLRVMISDNNAGIDDSLIGGVIDPKYTGYDLVEQWTSYGWNVFTAANGNDRSEEHTSELQSQSNLVCRLLLEKK